MHNFRDRPHYASVSCFGRRCNLGIHNTVFCDLPVVSRREGESNCVRLPRDFPKILSCHLRKQVLH